jgi:PEP-CTERM motif
MMLRAWSTNFLAAAGVLAAACCVAVSASAALIVNDTWRDTDRTDPASTVYAENNGMVGADADGDGDLESAWYRSGDGTMSVVAPGGGAAVNGSPNLLRTTLGAGTNSSASWTTYFTPQATPVTLGAAGDSMKVTWVFTPSGVAATPTTSQGFRMAFVDSPTRLTGDGTPGSAVYTGYALFLNFAQTTSRSTPYQLLERSGANSDLLSSGGNWGQAGDLVANATGFGTGAVGYQDGVQYTMTYMATRNALGELDIISTMSGGSGATALNGTGTVTLTANDPSPDSFVYDTFAIRPSGAASSATTFDTSLFKVEFIPGVPEPTSLILIAFGGMAMIGLLRRRK